MRTCAQSCSTQRGSLALSTRPHRPTHARARVRALRVGRGEARPAPPGGARARGRRRERDGGRVALVHHLPCGECERCRAGHESTCEAFAAPTIVPGGFAERGRATEAGSTLPDGLDDATRRRTSSRSPASSAAPSGCRRAECSSSARASSAGSSPRCCGAAATRSSRSDANPERPGASRTGRSTPRSCARPPRRSSTVAPGGTVLVFSPAPGRRPRRGLPPRADVVGSRRRRRRHMEEACRAPAGAGRPGADRPAARAVRRGPRAVPGRRSA